MEQVQARKAQKSSHRMLELRPWGDLHWLPTGKPGMPARIIPIFARFWQKGREALDQAKTYVFLQFSY
ncbi:MAG: hypothetical protein ACK50T_10580, partial [Sphingobacteriia bacterium]